MNTQTKFTLADYIEELAVNQPEEVISSFRDEINVFTIEELNNKANLLAKGLLYNGVDKDTPVALVLANTTNCLTFVIALAKIGATLIPLSKKMAIDDISEILKTMKVQTIGFYADEFLPTFNQIVPDFSQNERGYLQEENFPKLKNVVTFGSIKNRGIFTTRELMLLGAHMDDIEMEATIKATVPEDIFIKKINFSEDRKVNTQSIAYTELIASDFSISKLQEFLMELV